MSLRNYAIFLLVIVAMPSLGDECSNNDINAEQLGKWYPISGTTGVFHPRSCEYRVHVNRCDPPANPGADWDREWFYPTAVTEGVYTDLSKQPPVQYYDNSRSRLIWQHEGHRFEMTAINKRSVKIDNTDVDISIGYEVTTYSTCDESSGKTSDGKDLEKRTSKYVINPEFCEELKNDELVNMPECE